MRQALRLGEGKYPAYPQGMVFLCEPAPRRVSLQRPRRAEVCEPARLDGFRCPNFKAYFERENILKINNCENNQFNIRHWLFSLSSESFDAQNGL